MPYTDRWDVYSNGTISVVLDPLIVIAGVSSLKIAVGDVAARANLVPTTTGGLPQPALRGALRQRIRPVDLGGVGAGAACLGLAAIQSARNITISGSAYLAYFDGLNVVLGKIASGLSGTITVLASTAFAIVAGTTYTLEFEYNSDLVQMGGTHLILRTGTLADESDLTQRLNIVDSTAPLSATLGEGPIFRTPASPTACDVRYDTTRQYRP